jgi:hypothetical protein
MLRNVLAREKTSFLRPRDFLEKDTRLGAVRYGTFNLLTFTTIQKEQERAENRAEEPPRYGELKEMAISLSNIIKNDPDLNDQGWVAEIYLRGDETLSRPILQVSYYGAFIRPFSVPFKVCYSNKWKIDPKVTWSSNKNGPEK